MLAITIPVEPGEREDLERCFLLTGKPRVGKSTAIKRMIRQMGPEHFGGFYTEEIRRSADRIGFQCVTLSGQIARLASVDSESPHRVGRYGVDLDAFERVALSAMRLSLDTKKVTVIDEIGFMQMLSAPFEKRVHEVIAGGRQVILGTICVDSHPGIDKIKNLSGIKLYHLTEENREFAIKTAMNDLLPFLSL